MSSAKNTTMRKIPTRIWGWVTIAILALLAVYAGVFDSIEALIRGPLMAEPGYGTEGVSRRTEMIIVLCLCFGPALLHVESPLVMIAIGAGLAFTYLLIFSLVLFTYELVLPIVSPLLSLLASTIVTGTSAWSAERRHRRVLESLESSKQQFTDMLVHDLKTRMSSVLMSISALQKKHADAGEDVREMTETIRASAERILLLTGNLLDIRKMEEGKLVLNREAASLGELLRESLRDHRPAANLAGVTLAIQDPAGVRVRVDRSIFGRLMANLTWNALQHAPSGSTIDVSSEAGDGVARIVISNRGEPVPSEKQESLFQAFVSGDASPEDSRAASTGLGLTFCKLAVEAHGGTIRLESPWSDTGDGVRLSFALPLAD